MIHFAEKTQVDFVVIGGGGAGAIVAKELSAAGLRVVLLEQGPYLHEGDFQHDELQFKDIFDPATSNWTIWARKQPSVRYRSLMPRSNPPECNPPSPGS